MIKLKNISKIFYQKDKDIHALKDINLEVAKGEIFGIIGSSGAGKSTLIRCVNLLEKPTSGDVIVNNKNLTQILPNELKLARQNIAMIFQHFNLLSSKTISENINLALEIADFKKKDRQNRIDELLNLVDLSDKKDVYPANLSGGQKQRVAIARALANNPQVLLCDEATSALDPETTNSILDLLKTINQKLGITILLITHEMEVVKRICHKVAIINQGKLIEQNTVSAFFSNPQTDLAKNFINSILHLEIPANIKLIQEKKQASSVILKLEFQNNHVDDPLIANLARKTDLEISIIKAQVENIADIKFGFMLIKIKYNNSLPDLDNAINFLIASETKVEILGYVE